MSKSNGEKTQGIQINQELTDKRQRGMLKILNILLADETVLYNRLRNYHWNVRGINFYTLHTAFEDQFNKIADMTDEVAECIRQYGAYVPGTMNEFIQKAHLSEVPGVYPDAETMVANLVTDHELIIHFLHGDIETIDHKSKDVGVADLLVRLLQQHEKMAWMLRMFLKVHPTADKE